MEGCPEKKELLQDFLDHEKGAEQVKEHLKTCEACAKVVERNQELEDLFTRTLRPPENTEFLSKVKARIQRKTSPLRKALIVCAASAAAFLLMWAYFQLPKMEAVQEDPHVAALNQVQDILMGLSKVPEEYLLLQYGRAVAPLKKKGWRTDAMVAYVIKNSEGDARRVAIRLACELPSFEKTPGAISALIHCLKQRSFPEETMLALSVVDGPRAEAALGELLTDGVYQEFAFAHLKSMGGEGPQSQMVRFLLKARNIQITSFYGKILNTLSQMSPNSMEEVIRFYKKSRYNPDVVEALSPLNERGQQNLQRALNRIRGSDLIAGLKLASALRQECAITYLRNLSKRKYIEDELPNLIAQVGGAKGVFVLVDMYKAPISLAERQRLCNALARIFILYPDETGASLAPPIQSFEAEDKEILMEMLSKADPKGASPALSWIIRNQPQMASSAALNLARTNSQVALETLIKIYQDPEAPETVKLSVGAAILHLGGQDALAKDKDGPPQTRPKGAITENRFQKLKKKIARYSNPIKY